MRHHYLYTFLIQKEIHKSGKFPLETPRRDQFKEDEIINITQKISHAFHFLGCKSRDSNGFRWIWGLHQHRILCQPRTSNEKVEKEEPSVWLILSAWQWSIYTCGLLTAAIQGCTLTVFLDHPYSPDLAPSDFYLFYHLKRALRGWHFSSKMICKKL